MKSLLEIFDIPLSNTNELEYLLTKSIVHKRVKKGTILQMQGTKASKAFLVKKGLLRSYIIDEGGKEHIFLFAPEGWLVSDLESQVKDSEAELFIDALEDSELEVIDRKALEEIQMKQIPYSVAMEKLMKRVGVLQRRVIMLMSMSAKKRYVHFLKTYPDIPNRVPQKMIASYLGITPEALSKIRGAMARES